MEEGTGREKYIVSILHYAARLYSRSEDVAEVTHTKKNPTKKKTAETISI